MRSRDDISLTSRLALPIEKASECLIRDMQIKLKLVI